MIDVRTLLHAVAPRPEVVLDVVELRRHAERRSLRRVASWLAGGLAVVAVAVPTGQAVLSPAGDGPAGLTVDQIETPDVEPEEHAGVDAIATPTEAIALPPNASSPTAVPVAGESDPAHITGGESPTTSGAPATTTTERPAWWPPDEPAYPARSECSVDDVGLAPGRERRCRFTATAAGGASVDPEHSSVPSSQTADQVRVTVRRPNGEVMEWGGTSSYGVGDAQVFFGCDISIEPGDRVEVAIVAGDDPARTTVRAGEGHRSC